MSRYLISAILFVGIFVVLGASVGLSAHGILYLVGVQVTARGALILGSLGGISAAMYVGYRAFSGKDIGRTPEENNAIGAVVVAYCAWLATIMAVVPALVW